MSLQMFSFWELDAQNVAVITEEALRGVSGK